MKNLFTIGLCLLTFHLFSQEKLNWKTHVKKADEFFAKSLYADAAEHYEAAWRQKPKKKELIFKAAEAYYTIKDYKKAASAYQHVKDDQKNYPLAGLRYARCLKQDGNYDEASREFVYYREKYSGADRAILQEVVQNEILGCELGIKLSGEPMTKDVQLLHLSGEVNSPETEFAPIPFNDNVLYFSSNMSNKAKIYFTMREKEGDWKKAAPPKNFPEIPNEHFCNGTLTPDGKRFYFTICKSIENWGGLTTRCEINMIKKVGDTWTAPLRLRDYINLENATATHPFVLHKDGKEIIYFASNREGSIGGMDLWFVERSVDSDDIDFSFPVNLGGEINTLGDEMTPFYDLKDGVLYFSSNGHITLGGQDVFKATGGLTRWTTPENIGQPFNSSADDFYFTKSPTGHLGFLASNRIFGMEKITTTHEDLFEFRLQKEAFKQEVAERIIEEKPVKKEEPKQPVVATTPPPVPEALKVKGNIFDKMQDISIEGATVYLYEVSPENKKRLVANQRSETGKFEFTILPDRRFVLEAQKDGYAKSTMEFSSKEGVSVTEDLFMVKASEQAMAENTEGAPPAEVKKEDKQTVKINTSPKTSTKPSDTAKPKSKEPVMTKPEDDKISEPTAITSKDLEYTGAPYVARGRSGADNAQFSTSAPRHQGEYFKIQLLAIDKFDPAQERYQPIEGLGRLDTEFLTEKKLHRVLLAEFFSLDDAKAMLKTVQQKGFPKAFIVKYTEGERHGMIYR